MVWNITGHALPREDGEEVAADVFVAAWDHAADLRPGKVKAWLGAVARNKARNRLRSAGLDLPLEEEALEVAAPGGPVEEVERDEVRALLRRAVEDLGPPDRDILSAITTTTSRCAPWPGRWTCRKTPSRPASAGGGRS